ncbi:hypothetical protein D9M71_825740 [compost metagenome]
MDIDQQGLTQTGLGRVLEVVEHTKNLRSHLETVLVSATSTSLAYAAVAINTGHEINLSGYRPGAVVINELALILEE